MNEIEYFFRRFAIVVVIALKYKLKTANARDIMYKDGTSSSNETEVVRIAYDWHMARKAATDENKIKQIELSDTHYGLCRLYAVACVDHCVEVQFCGQHTKRIRIATIAAFGQI